MDDIKPGCCDGWQKRRLGEGNQGRKAFWVCDEQFINIDVNDAIIPFQQACTELTYGASTSFVVLRRAGYSDPINIAKIFGGAIC
ncbi:hypothetical protein AA103581_2308 [Gluconobacter wancherniae NBRC 103581]|nr:hypothetical protein AA103581_2308 [Gluconobacter wancherniae NBRC 103581]